MTRMDFFEKVIEANISEEMNEYAKQYIANLKKANNGKLEKRAKENEPLLNAIVEHMKTINKPQFAVDIGEVLNVTTSKASALLKTLVAKGILTKEQKVREGKRNVSYEYSLVK